MDSSTPSEALDAELRQRIAEDPLAALSAMTKLRRELAERERDAVFLALETHSWREIGEALGISKQAAFQRFGKEWLTMTRAKLPKSAWKRAVKDRISDK